MARQAARPSWTDGGEAEWIRGKIEKRMKNNEERRTYEGRSLKGKPAGVVGVAVVVVVVGKTAGGATKDGQHGSF